MTKLEKLAEIFDLMNEKVIWSKKITVYGYQFNYCTTIQSPLSKYWFGECKIEELICPLNCESSNHNRPGLIKESTEYITIHDTASSKDSADEYAHAKYVANGGGGTSWHYSVGAVSSLHQVPDNEVAYHAGDSLDVRFCLTNTRVKGANPKPEVTIQNGYYYLDNQKTIIRAPIVTYELNHKKELVYASDGITQGKLAPSDSKKGDIACIVSTKDINDAGIRIDLGNDGYYYMGPTYYNANYKRIANRGGNLNSIGIESMVNQGSNLMRTWHRLAKLVAHLLIDNNLPTSHVKPHHFFSGKPCPMTLRENNLWDYFMKCVEVEYLILKEYSDVKIELICENVEVNPDGIFEQDKKISSDVIEYQIKLTHFKDIKVLNYRVKVVK